MNKTTGPENEAVDMDALIGNCEAARKMRDVMSDALKDALTGHERGVVSADWVRFLTSVYNHTADSLDGLKLVLSTFPVSTLDGVVAKFSVLRDEDLQRTIERWKGGDQAIVAAVERGLRLIPDSSLSATSLRATPER